MRPSAACLVVLYIDFIVVFYIILADGFIIDVSYLANVTHLHSLISARQVSA